MEERARLSQGIPRDTWNRGGFFKVLGMCFKGGLASL